MLALKKEVESLEKKISSKKKAKDNVKEPEGGTETKSRRSSRLNPSLKPPSAVREERGVKVGRVERRQVEGMKEKVEGRKGVSRVPARKRKAEEKENSKEMCRIHVGSGGEEDLQMHLRGEGGMVLQVLEEVELPDISCREIVNGLDRDGTARDYVDDNHRCSVRCPVGCQGHLRPNECVVYLAREEGGLLTSRRRLKARLVRDQGGHTDVVLAQLRMKSYRRIGRKRRRGQEEEERRRQARHAGQVRAMEEDRNDSPIPPLPDTLGYRMPQQVSALLVRPPVARAVAEEHGWSIQDSSHNVELKAEDVLTMRRRPVAQSTDCARSKVGYSSGLHVFRVSWPVRQRGTHAMVGVSTRAAPMQGEGYRGLLGDSPHSWGWDLGRKRATHQGQDSLSPLYPPWLQHHHQWQVPDTFHMVLDMDRGTLAWVAHGQYLGVSHRGILGTVFPTVSTVWGHCEVSLRYLGSLDSGALLPLRALARVEVLRALGTSSTATSHLDAVGPSLGLPPTLVEYLAGSD